jgi:hypothetical protein
MAAGSTYVPIATTTLGSATASYTFSSIPSTYTDLVLIGSNVAQTTGSNYLGLQFNSDVAANYSCLELWSDGSSANSNVFANLNLMQMGNGTRPGTTNYCSFIWNIMNYSNSTTYKTVLGKSNNPSSSAAYPGVNAIVGLWRSTAAITSLTILPIAGNIKSTTVFTLYGIAGA